MSQNQFDPFHTDKDGHRLLPSFTFEERDRRYGRLREFMAARHLDCLIAPPAEPFEPQANSRYLTQIGGIQGGAWGVLPLEGEAVAIAGSEREQVMWKRYLRWPEDIRYGKGSELVPDRLRELGLERGCIGVSGLANQYYRPEGVIPFETWTRITKALPSATFVPANDVFERARVTKGPEEIAVVRRIAAADEAAIARMAEVALPGVEEATVWFELNDLLCRATGDWPARLSFGSGGRPANAGNSMALPIRLEDGSILHQEIDARLQGYRGQCNHSLLIGKKGADRYREAMKAAVEVFLALIAWIKPGKSVGEFLEEFERLAETRKGKARGMVFHTCGLGSDRPRTGVGEFARDRDWTIEPGWTFTIKTEVRLTESGVSALVGEPVTVDERGARRLGRRHLVPIVTG